MSSVEACRKREWACIHELLVIPGQPAASASELARDPGA